MKLDKVIAVRNNKTVYQDGDKAIKVFEKNYAKSDIFNEVLNHARVEETGLSVPKITGVTTVDGKWAISMEFIEGKTLAALMTENPKKKSEYLNSFVDLQMSVHALKSPLVTKLKDKMIQKISIADIDEATKYDLHTRLDAMPKHNKLCHGDFNPSNIIVDGLGKAYIIDWSHVTQGNASADAARTYLLFCLAGDTDGAEEYLSLYCEKSGTEKQYVQKWLPIVAASQSTKGNPEEREFLLHWTNVVDYE